MDSTSALEPDRRIQESASAVFALGHFHWMHGHFGEVATESILPMYSSNHKREGCETGQLTLKLLPVEELISQLWGYITINTGGGSNQFYATLDMSMYITNIYMLKDVMHM